MTNHTLAPFPFFHQIDESERVVDERMDDLAEEEKLQDVEDVKYMKDYRRNSGWDQKAKRGQKIYNVVQTMTPEDEVSRIFLGTVRTMIDRGIEQMTEGEPDFSFEPFGPSDHMKTIIWKHMIKQIMSKCEYKMHQELFFRDYFVMGSGVFQIYIDYPKRTLRIPNPAMEGGFEEVVTLDHRRPKVGVRAVNPLDCWRNPNIENTTQVPSCLRRRIITWNQFAQEYGRCPDDDGENRYENMDKISKGSHVCIYTYEDEIRDICRVYARSFGNQSDGFPLYPLLENDLGVRILNESLKIHEEKENGIVTRCTGINVPGICTLRWGTFFDMYDKNYTGHHSAYGMGLPQRLEGEDIALQTIFNQNLDNSRWAGTVALNYKGNQADSYMDLDANRLYGGELIDGEITPMPLGIQRVNDYSAMKDSIEQDNIVASGINFKQIVGDTSKTAYEFAQRIKQSTRSSEQRLQRLENEVFSPMGSLLLANALTTLTVNEYEDMTEDGVAAAKAAIKTGVKTAYDYEDLTGQKPRRRKINWLPMKGEKIKETFVRTKKRKLDYNADVLNDPNTLVHDSSMNVETSWVPIVQEYVYPLEYIEQGLMPDCIVDSKRMLGDMKAQDVQNWQSAANFIMQLVQLGYKNIDLDKMVSEALEFAEIDPKTIIKTDTGSSANMDMADQLVQQMSQSSPQSPNAQPTQPIGPPSAPQFASGGAPAVPQGPGGAQNAFNQL